MSLKQVKVPVSELLVGMYVTQLDRPWCETPFPIQGFFIQNNDDVLTIAGYCKYVMVDAQVSRVDVAVKHSVDSGRSRKKEKELKKTTAQVTQSVEPIVIKKPVKYVVSSSLKSEARKAERLYAEVHTALDKVFEQGSHDPTSVKYAHKAASAMVESVIRNPDALVWLAKVNEHHNASHQHSVNASIWALVFGRFLGLSKDLLVDLSVGVLLCSVGKTRIDKTILDKCGNLNAGEFESYKKYVEYGVEILERSGVVPNNVVSVVRCHRERHNGTGFPEQLSSHRIPLLAKIAGLVDCYQGMLDKGNGRVALSPVEAVGKLYDLRNIEFQADLVEKFIQAIGVYPTGTLVELTNNEVAIVLSNNPERRLWPKVMVVLDDGKKPLKKARIIDLLEVNSAPGNALLQITSSLPVGAHGVDTSKYLVTGATSRWSFQHLVG